MKWNVRTAQAHLLEGGLLLLAQLHLALQIAHLGLQLSHLPHAC